MEIGTVTIGTADLDKQVNELLDRFQRTIDAARAAWNAKPAVEDYVKPINGTCWTPHCFGEPDVDRKTIKQLPHPRATDCLNWTPTL